MTTTIVTGVFDNERDMERALDELYRQGFDEDNVDHLDLVTHDRVESWQNPALNAGAIGSVGGVAIGPTPLTVPGILGAASPGAREALVEMGIPEPEAPFYAQNLKHGGVILIVETNDDERASQARSILRQANALTPIRE